MMIDILCIYEYLYIVSVWSYLKSLPLIWFAFLCMVPCVIICYFQHVPSVTTCSFGQEVQLELTRGPVPDSSFSEKSLSFERRKKLQNFLFSHIRTEIKHRFSCTYLKCVYQGKWGKFHRISRWTISGVSLKLFSGSVPDQISSRKQSLSRLWVRPRTCELCNERTDLLWEFFLPPRGDGVPPLALCSNIPFKFVHWRSENDVSQLISAFWNHFGVVCVPSSDNKTQFYNFTHCICFCFIPPTQAASSLYCVFTFLKIQREKKQLCQ